MKKILGLIILLFSFSCFADCNEAPSTTDPTFCKKFEEIAICHCKVDGKGRIPCPNAKDIYKKMLGTFGTQQNACDYQALKGSEIRATSAQCMKDWDCYRLGAGQCYAKCM